ncbi:MAG: molybdenum cofactor guanylyltransferase [Gammaproteobacteria bacterium]|jgi:molybdenum cofactor guanylyltransferase|nr:molybdenum cofactor guanylyltransferase [Gammaproteobacteria bacterium]MBT7307273.1 molybdenum cofactor guanylyltransferase [Gammaproteobacteria bacterium]
MDEITGIILAGGRSRRMGGEDKGLSLLKGQPMIAYVIERLRPQVETLVISANRNHTQYRQFGYPVVADSLGEIPFQGPLAGIARAIHSTTTPYVLVTPCDTPLLPTHLVERLQSALQQGESPIAVAHDTVRLQPLCFLAKRSIHNTLTEQLNQGERRVQVWMESLQPSLCQFETPSLFSNINTPQERTAIEQQMEQKR